MRPRSTYFGTEFSFPTDVIKSRETTLEENPPNLKALNNLVKNIKSTSIAFTVLACWRPASKRLTT